MQGFINQTKKRRQTVRMIVTSVSKKPVTPLLLYTVAQMWPVFLKQTLYVSAAIIGKSGKTAVVARFYRKNVAAAVLMDLDGPCLTIYSLFTIYRDIQYQLLVWWKHYTHCCESKKWKPGKFHLCSLRYEIFNYPNWDFRFC